MAEAQFMPGAPVGYAADAAFKGLEQGQSFMERASRLRQMQQMEQLQRQQIEQNELLRPIEVAKHQADAATSLAQMEAAKQTQQQRLQVTPILAEARTNFNSIMKLPDSEQRANAGLQWISKYGQMANLKETSEEFGSYKDIIGKMYLENTTLKKLQATGEVQKELTGMKIQSAQDIAAAKAETATQIAELKAAGKASPAQQKFQEETGTLAAKYLDLQAQKTAENIRTLDTVQQSRKLLESGEEQGLGEAAKTTVMQAINAATRTAGAPDIFDTSKREQLQRNYSDMSLQAAARMKNQGQITESERKLLQNTVAQFGNSKKAALFIMDYMQAVAQREIEKTKWLNAKAQAGEVVNSAMEPEFYDQNPLVYYLPARDEKEAEKAAESPIVIKSIKRIN